MPVPLSGRGPARAAAGPGPAAGGGALPAPPRLRARAGIMIAATGTGGGVSGIVHLVTGTLITYNAIYLVYQSKLSLGTGRSLSVPGLCHIRYPTRRPLCPDAGVWSSAFKVAAVQAGPAQSSVALQLHPPSRSRGRRK